VTVAGIAAALDRYRAAILAGDRAALDALLDTDYEFVSAHARVMDRERRLTALTASAGNLADLAFSNLDIRMIDSVVIVRADFRAEFRPHAGRADPDHGVSTFVLSRNGNNWRLRHQHNSHGT
jgi:ketosteroid isomerase-like protein